MPWRSRLNAEIYDRFVREHRIYAWLNRQLVELARVESSRRVLDLACGTGATTLACLAAVGARAEVVGIDASEGMVAVARANVLDPRARFEVLAAADGARLEGTFDRVVCNAALWQFPATAPVLHALARRTSPGARFVFNVPAERVTGESAPAHPFQMTLMRQIESATGRRFESRPATVDPARLQREAREAGFVLVDRERRVYQGRQEELMELMGIPAMIDPLTPGMADEEREALLADARARCDPALAVEVPWIYFIVERVAAR